MYGLSPIKACGGIVCSQVYFNAVLHIIPSLLSFLFPFPTLSFYECLSESRNCIL